jgi:hypothetical protein
MAKKHHHSSHNASTTITPSVVKELQGIPNGEMPVPIKSIEILFGSLTISTSHPIFTSHPAAFFFGTNTYPVA